MVSEIQDAIWALDEGGLSEMVEYECGRARCRWCGQNIQRMPVIWVTTVPTEQKATFTVIRKTVEEDRGGTRMKRKLLRCGRPAMNITSERCTHCKKIRQGKMLQAEVNQ